VRMALQRRRLEFFLLPDLEERHNYGRYGYCNRRKSYEVERGGIKEMF